MGAMQVDEITREMARLRRAVDAVVATAQPADLPTIHGVLTEAASAVEAIGTRRASGGYVVDLPVETAFPSGADADSAR